MYGTLRLSGSLLLSHSKEMSNMKRSKRSTRGDILERHNQSCDTLGNVFLQGVRCIVSTVTPSHVLAGTQLSEVDISDEPFGVVRCVPRGNCLQSVQVKGIRVGRALSRDLCLSHELNERSISSNNLNSLQLARDPLDLYPSNRILEVLSAESQPLN